MKDILTWLTIGLASLNIFVRISFCFYQSFLSLKSAMRKNRKEAKLQEIMDKKYDNDRKLLEEDP